MRNVKHESVSWLVNLDTHGIFLTLYIIGFLSETISHGFMQEEDAAVQKVKEEEAAALEFEKWKGEFSVDAEGTTESEVQDGSQGLLFDFVEYIKVV